MDSGNVLQLAEYLSLLEFNLGTFASLTGHVFITALREDLIGSTTENLYSSGYCSHMQRRKHWKSEARLIIREECRKAGKGIRPEIVARLIECLRANDEQEVREAIERKPENRRRLLLTPIVGSYRF